MGPGSTAAAEETVAATIGAALTEPDRAAAPREDRAIGCVQHVTITTSPIDKNVTDVRRKNLILWVVIMVAEEDLNTMAVGAVITTIRAVAIAAAEVRRIATTIGTIIAIVIEIATVATLARAEAEAPAVAAPAAPQEVTREWIEMIDDSGLIEKIEQCVCDRAKRWRGPIRVTALRK